MNDFILTESGQIVERAPLQAKTTASVPKLSTRPPSRRRALDRRAFLATGARAVMVMSLWPTLDRAFTQPGHAATNDPWTLPGMSPEVTPTEDFYTISKNLFDPVVDEKPWKLTIDGLVHRPFTMDYRTLTTSGPTVQTYVTLTCISNPIGGTLTGNALWRGIPLKDVLQQAGIQEGAVDLVMESHDEYTDSIPIEKAMHPDTLLVWEMNGEPLTPKHGFPARLIVPGIYGMKNAKWIRRLTVVDHDYKGFWERRGWSDIARVNTWSRIDIPDDGRISRGNPVVIGGLAYAGDRGVKAVEWSADNGGSWQSAAMKDALAPYAWRLWSTEWKPADTGQTTLLVRAIDGAGEIQTATVQSTLPDGATGYHRRRVRVTG